MLPATQATCELEGNELPHKSLKKAQNRYLHVSFWVVASQVLPSFDRN